MAQEPSFELTPEDEINHNAQADLWLDTVFGHCFYNITGEALSEHPGELQGQWNDLRPDYASTLIQPLNDPKQSDGPQAVILDWNDEKTSCWTQYSSLVPSYAAEEFGKVQTALANADRLKIALVDQGNGPQQVGVILVGEKRVPVIFYQSVAQQGPVLTIVTIVQKTVPDFKYSDFETEVRPKSDE